MVEARDLFGLVAIGDTLYATAGIGNHGVYHSSVETFSRQGGWRLQEGMDLGNRFPGPLWGGGVKIQPNKNVVKVLFLKQNISNFGVKCVLKI